MDILETLKGELLKEGTKSDKIALLQETLKKVGVDPGAADGIFGPQTKAAVEAFQAKAGLSKDGVVGPNTAKALKQAAIEAVTKAAKDKFSGATGKEAAADVMGKVGGLFGGKK